MREGKKQPVAWPPNPIGKDERRKRNGVCEEPDTQSYPNQERNHIGDQYDDCQEGSMGTQDQRAKSDEV
jgi:hypothetical protein